MNLSSVGLSKSQINRRRDRFERDLNLYSGVLYSAGRFGQEQPPYMPELRALYMAVRETYKGGFGKGQTVDHMWPRVVGAKKKERGLIART